MTARLERLSPAEQRELTELLDEKHRRLVKKDFGAWCRHALEPLGQKPARHHQLMIRELQAVADGRTKRLILQLPPGSAKSTYASKLFAPWLMARTPKCKIIAAAHTQTLAELFSSDVQNLISEHEKVLGYRLISFLKKRWSSSNGGQYRSAGVGAKLPGFRGDFIILDDLVPNAKAADSEGQRETIWNWYLSDLDARLTPGGAIVLAMTRWHQDDIAGRLLSLQPDTWKVVNLPAIAEENDLLGRAPGEPLWSDDSYGYGAQMVAKRAELERAGAARVWSALYQQHPRPLEGSVFRVAEMQFADAVPASVKWARAWDLAATAADGGTDPDWTCGVKIGVDPNGRYWVGDVRRIRGGPQVVEQTIVETARMDGNVTVGLPQDPGQAGKAQIAYLTSKLAGHRVLASPESGSKETRAMPVASQVNVGNVTLLRGSWNAPFVEELRDFPTGRKDDQVDALSRAFSLLINPAAAARTVQIPFLGR